MEEINQDTFEIMEDVREMIAEKRDKGEVLEIKRQG